MKFQLSLVYTALFTSLYFGSAMAKEPLASDEETLEQIDVSADYLQQLGYHAVGTSSVSKVNVPIIELPYAV